MTVVKTELGNLRGVDRGRHLAFLGVPFAAPPVGPRRFSAPAPVEGWSGVRDATAFGPSALQSDHAIPGFAASGATGEDCLYLDVYTPATEGARPVMLWIHGGGFTHGTGSEPLYDGGHLAERGDVVVVAIHYRLAALGYADLVAHGGAEWGAVANPGQLDQVAALEWVRDHIERFGGDPGNVTIFGQSAGGGAVATLLTMPSARGLFRRAVIQSSGGRLRPRERATALAGALLDELGIDRDDSRAILDLPADAIVEAQVRAVETLRAQGVEASWGPVVDGEVVPETPLEAVQAGAAADVPLMLGNNRDEVKQFVAMDRNRQQVADGDLPSEVAQSLPGGAAGDVATATQLIEVYRSSRDALGLPTTNNDLLDAIDTDARFRIPGIELALAQREHQPSTFVYLFTHESPARRGALGACHSLEMPFVFGSLDAPTQDRFAGTGPDVEALSARMMDAWTSFARSGNPSHAGIGGWDPYTEDDRCTMVFGPETGRATAPFEAERAAWAAIAV
jgi:para-nitrobenzyl esterase